MVFRKRKNPTPAFNLPEPFNPITAERAGLPNPRDITRLAYFQVFEEDNHSDYLVCRGFDPESGHFYDGTKGTVSVAKPWNLRGRRAFEVGWILVCCKCKSLLGENAGKAESSVGQPADVVESIVPLADDEGKWVTWISLTWYEEGSSMSLSSPSPSSPSPSPSPSPGGGSKSTAIVPASWTPDGYAAWFVTESPEVRFEDYWVIRVYRQAVDVPIEPHYLEGCEPGTVLVLASVDTLVLVAASIRGNKIHIEVDEDLPKDGIVVTLHLVAVRKGFKGLRLPNRTQAQFEANERFIRSAYGDV